MVIHYPQEIAKSLLFSITTNGTLIDEDKLDYLIENKIFLMISLDGDRQTHDNNRIFLNGNPTFEVVTRNLNMIKKMDDDYYKYYIIFSTTLTEGCDYKQLDRFFSNYQKACKISGVLSYGSQNIKPVKDKSINMKYIINKFVEGCRIRAYDNIDTSGPYIFALNVVGTVIKMLHKRNVSENYISDEEYLFKNHCIPGSTKIFVSPEGYFYPCEKLDSHDHLIIGDINNGVNLTKVNELLQEFIIIKRDFCKDCFLLDICNLCFQSASNGIEWDREKFRLFCQYAKNDFKNGLIIYSTILENDENALEYLSKS